MLSGKTILKSPNKIFLGFRIFDFFSFTGIDDLDENFIFKKFWGYKNLHCSGCTSSAIEGASLIKRLMERADGRIIIMAGAGVRSSNCLDLISLTGVPEIHSSSKTKVYVWDIGFIPALKRKVYFFKDWKCTRSTLPCNKRLANLKRN